jgi:hypothetical protein
MLVGYGGREQARGRLHQRGGSHREVRADLGAGLADHVHGAADRTVGALGAAGRDVLVGVPCPFRERAEELRGLVSHAADIVGTVRPRAFAHDDFSSNLTCSWPCSTRAPATR